jgi:hypothetical protein
MRCAQTVIVCSSSTRAATSGRVRHMARSSTSRSSLVPTSMSPIHATTARSGASASVHERRRVQLAAQQRVARPVGARLVLDRQRRARAAGNERLEPRAHALGGRPVRECGAQHARITAANAGGTTESPGIVGRRPAMQSRSSCDVNEPYLNSSHGSSRVAISHSVMPSE